MRRIQRGFTIIELMIVVAVIGVLASIAIPLYTDYTERSKLSEALQLLSAVRMPMHEYYEIFGHWPTIADVGGKDSGEYVASLTAGEDGGLLYAEATMKGAIGDSPIAGRQVRVVYYPEEKNWICTSNGSASPVPEQYLPGSCK